MRGGPEEIIEEGRTGWLVPVGDVAAMAARLGWLLDHPAEAAAMGAAGRVAVAEQFSPERAEGKFKAMFDL